MANDEEQLEEGTEEELELPEQEDTEQTPEEAPPQEKTPKQRTPEEQLKYLEGRAQRLRSKLGLTAPRKTPAKEEAKTGGLDETQLDYLDVKGITENDDIKIIERHVQRTGETVRQALKDDYVQSKLKANKDKREVSEATPSSNKRGAAAGNDSVAIALAKFESTGELPNDFKLRSQVINAKADKENPNKPSWH